MVWQLLAKPLLGVVADGVKGFVETKKAKQELKLTEIKATQVYIAISASFGIKAGSSAIGMFKKK
jgi:hypothetical protein